MSPYFIPTFKHPCNSKLVSYNFLLWCTSSKRHSALNTFLLFLAYCRPCVTLWHGSILSSNHLRNWDILLGDLEEFADFLVRLNESPDLVITHKHGCYKYKYKMISHIIKIKKKLLCCLRKDILYIKTSHPAKSSWSSGQQWPLPFFALKRC